MSIPTRKGEGILPGLPFKKKKMRGSVNSHGASVSHYGRVSDSPWEQHEHPSSCVS